MLSFFAVFILFYAPFLNTGNRQLVALHDIIHLRFDSSRERNQAQT